MALHTRTNRLPTATALAGLLLALYYAFVFQPLSRRVASLDQPLTNAWHRLVMTNRAHEACAGLGLSEASRRVDELRGAWNHFEAAQRMVASRLQLPQEINARLAEPFQLIDFQNDRSRQAEALVRLAKEQGVACDLAAVNGLPEYSVDLVDPRLLWPRLFFARQLLLAAVHCKVGGLRALIQLPSIDHRADRSGDGLLEELPMRLELFGPAEAVARFVTSLPLRGDDLNAVGLGAVLTNKPIFLVDQVFARKHSPESPGDVLLELSVSGWVLASGEPPEAITR